ncbi:hypothetical protein CPB86DRAFT_626582 [Serendipita vermifera]|nr:hypothetical protein CPB86DRAFT_626582 [Serendipita vermifera]
MSETSQPVRALSLIKKSEDITNEEFRRYWEKEHSQKMLPFLKKYGALYYSQTYLNQDSQRAIAEAINNDKAGSLDYDGIATIVFPSQKVAEEFTKDPEVANTTREGPKSWSQITSTRIMAGEEVVFLNQTAHK